MKRLPCGVVREAISALLDGELPPLREEEVEGHIATCPPCAAHRRHLRALARATRLRSVTEVPSVALSVLETTAAPSWRRALSWCVALAAVGAALPALGLGAFSHVHLAPTHLLTPCTHALVSIHRHRPSVSRR